MGDRSNSTNQSLCHTQTETKKRRLFFYLFFKYQLDLTRELQDSLIE